MSGVLLKKLLRELWQRKGSLGALILIGSVGISFLVSMVGVYIDLDGSKQSFYRDYRLADFSIQLKRAPNSILPQLQHGNVRLLEGRIRSSGRVELESFADPISAIVISAPNPRRPVFNDLLLKSGTWFSDNPEREVIVNDAFCKAHDLLPGDMLTLIVLGQAQEFQIVGRVQSPEFVYVLPNDGGFTPDPARSAVLYVAHEVLEEATDLKGGFNELIGAVHDPSRPTTKATLSVLERELDEYGVIASTPQWDVPSVQFMQSEIDGLKVSATVMPLICLAVVMFVLNIVIGRLVSQQRTVIGTLKALGYSSELVTLHYLGFGIGVGVGSAIGGVAMGSWLQSALLDLYKEFYELPISRPGSYPEVIGFAIGVSLVSAVAGAALGVRKMVRLEPAEAMRAPPPEKGGGIWLERIPWIWERLPFLLKLVLRTIFRNPFRTMVTAGTAVMATALVVQSLSMLGSVEMLIQHEFVDTARQDVSVMLREPAGEASLRELATLPGVKRVEAQLNLPCELSIGSRKRLTAVTGLQSSDGLKLVLDTRGHALKLPDEGLVLSTKLAEILQVEVGDTIHLKALLAERREVEVPVVALVDTFMGLGAYAKIEYLSRLLGEEWVANSLLLTVDASEKESLTVELRTRPMVLSGDWRLVSLAKIKETLNQSMGMMLTVILLFSGGLAFGTVLNTSLVSLSERQREVGTLRVLGYSPFQVAQIFIGESLLVNGFGVVLGWGLGVQLVYLMSSAYDTEVFRFPPVVPPSAILYSTVVMFVSLSLAQLLTHRSLVSLPWLDVLKTRE